MRLWLSASCLLALGVSAAAHAEGSVVFEQADRYLKTAPELRAHLMSTLCISRNGLASRLSGQYPLGGLRIGPYEFEARPRGQPNGPHFLLRVVTWQELFDEDGKPVLVPYGQDEPWERAFRIDEHFRAVELSPARAQDWVPGLKSVNCAEAI